MTARRVYLDTSALVKLVVAEPETQALLTAVDRWPEQVTSEITVTELTRAVRRAAPHALPRAVRLLEEVGLVRMHRRLLDEAGRVGPPETRSLDAIHIATARLVGATAVITYDRRMAESLSADGFEVLSPA
ncbi:MAG: type II toxin-antitoxin system VapC family toxin [Actinobacteria bacterium]|nr:type II toxin-antitoxin system VapC family toxin [Actinomycetota bacterium]